MSSKHNYDIQGHFLGIPYDFRMPTWRKIATRWYLPGGPALVPKVFGAGWQLNFAHRGGRALGLALVVVVFAALLTG